MIKVLSVFGTRPEAIKMAPVVRELARHPDVFDAKVCVTAQHRQMLDQVLTLFEIDPDYDLDIMRPGQALTDVTCAVLRGLEPILQVEKPDWVLVQGDTTTVMAASLAAYYQKIRIGHVEAGLRTHDKYQPFPEEINRRVVSTMADVHFAPTVWAADNLRREGVLEERIAVTGNTVIDALHHILSLPLDSSENPLAELSLDGKRIILVTAHRRENFGRGIEEICAGVRGIAERYADVHVIYPVHPNPNVHDPVHRLLDGLTNVTLMPPLSYQPLVHLLNQCSFVITDSGGLQEEAPGLGKPVLVLRDTTERPESITAGSAILVGANREKIIEWACFLLDRNDIYCKMAHAVNPYGDGDAGPRSVDALLKSHSL